MKWSILNKLYGGIIGNSIFLISAISSLTMMPLFYVVFSSMASSVSILGSIIIVISFGIQKICIPDLINNHNTYDSYYNHVLWLKTKKAFDNIHEFGTIEQYEKINDLCVFKDPSFNLYKFSSIEEYLDMFGEERTTYYLSIIKHSLINVSREKIRISLTISLMAGISMMYYAPAQRLAFYIYKGVTNG